MTRDKRRATPSEKRTFYAQLRGYAQERGKSESWVLANFRDKFKEWPHTKHVPPEAPGPDVMGWVHSRRIAFAKSRERVAA